MDCLFFLAEAAQQAAQTAAQAGSQTTDAMPLWMKAALGPLSGLVISLGWIIFTEKRRIPTFRKLVDDLVVKLETRDAAYKEEIEKVRTEARAREEDLEKKVADWTARCAKESRLGTFWRAKAESAYDRLGEDPPDPGDIKKTRYDSPTGPVGY